MVQQVDATSITPRRFWQRYVAQRQPVVLNGIDKQWIQFTDEFLKSKAGGVPVLVEHRSNAKDSYGQGRKSPMQFADFISAMEGGDSSLYMSTQEVGVGRDGHPLLLGPPLIQLRGHFPQQLPLMGHLVPQSINMWMGCAPHGSSSGLHHDYHDNLFVLLRGSKRFQLYPPSCAPDMYVRGRLKKIYTNGRIVYEGQGDILPDGSDAHDVRLWQARHAADQAAAAAHGEDAADAVLEQQLEAMLDEEAGLSAEWDLADDYVDSDDVAADPDLSSDEDLGPNNKQHSKKRKASQQHPKSTKKRKLVAAEAAGSSSKAAKAAGGGAIAAAAPQAAPVSFSEVDLSLPAAELRRKYPRFPGVAAAQEVVLRAGQMLYLPAGWFHEVTSFGESGHNGGHLALNYWYHPPDNLNSSKAGFKQPYTKQYYPTIWAQRQPWLQEDTERWWQQQQRHRGAAAAATPRATAAAAAGAGNHKLSVELAGSPPRHIQWVDEVHSPSNKYRMSMTRQGTATGDVSRTPTGCKHSNRPTYGTINGTDSDGGSDRDSPCSSRDNSAAVVHDHQHSPENHQPASDECSLRHLTAPAGHNSPRDNGVATQNGQHTAKHGKQQQHVNGAVSQQQRAHDQSHRTDANDDDEENLSEDVLAGIKAVEDYFSGNPAAAKHLLQEFLSQRRQRIAASSRSAERMVALPRLLGRRHHYAVAVKVVPRKPARR